MQMRVERADDNRVHHTQRTLTRGKKKKLLQPNQKKQTNKNRTHIIRETQKIRPTHVSAAVETGPETNERNKSQMWSTGCLKEEGRRGAAGKQLDVPFWNGRGGWGEEGDVTAAGFINPNTPHVSLSAVHALLNSL